MQFLYGSIDVGWSPTRGILQASASTASMILSQGRFMSLLFLCNQKSPFSIDSVQFGTSTGAAGSSITYGPYGYNKACTTTSESHYLDGLAFLSGSLDGKTNALLGLVLNKVC